ncbi:MAG: M14 family metallopeptidase [Planctomycetota bacterium]|jgi:hypothetical protein
MSPPLRRLLCLLPLLAAVGLGPPARADEPEEEGAIGYVTSGEVGRVLRQLQAQAEARGLAAEVREYGRSAGGRPLRALRLGGEAPVVLVHGGLGRRDAAAVRACLHFAERLVGGAEEGRSVSWLIVPAPHPDALDGFLRGDWPHGGLHVDRDRDGRRGEDGPSDIDGDGEILRMRRPSPRGAWGPGEAAPGPSAEAGDGEDGEDDEDGEGGKGGETEDDAEGPAAPRTDPRWIEERGVDGRRETSWEVWTEGVDDDGDGDVNEDGPGLDLTRQFAGWWDDKGPWGGDGPFPGLAPEVKALMDLSLATPGLIAWYGFTGVGDRILRASEEGDAADADDELYDRLAGALRTRTGLEVARASEVAGRAPNPGSDLDWACVHLGVPAFRVPVWRIARQEGHAGERDAPDGLDWLLWNDRVLEGEGFRPWTPYEHPTLGSVEIGGWRRFSRWEPPASLLPEAVRAVSGGPLAHARFRPSLVADVEVTARGEGLYEIAVRAVNTGEGPTNTAVAEGFGRVTYVRARLTPAEGVEVLGGPPVADLGRVEAGAASEPARWLLRRKEAGPLGQVVLFHPAAGRIATSVETR